MLLAIHLFYRPRAQLVRVFRVESNQARHRINFSRSDRLEATDSSTPRTRSNPASALNPRSDPLAKRPSAPRERPNPLDPVSDTHPPPSTRERSPASAPAGKRKPPPKRGSQSAGANPKWCLAPPPHRTLGSQRVRYPRPWCSSQSRQPKRSLGR